MTFASACCCFTRIVLIRLRWSALWRGLIRLNLRLISLSLRLISLSLRLISLSLRLISQSLRLKSLRLKFLWRNLFDRARMAELVDALV